MFPISHTSKINIDMFPTMPQLFTTADILPWLRWDEQAASHLL